MNGFWKVNPSICDTWQTWSNAWWNDEIFQTIYIPFSYLSGQDAEEDEDEHALEGVGDGEQVGGQGGLVEDMEQAKRPGGPQHEQQGQGPAGTGPGGAPEHFTSPQWHHLMHLYDIT